ncbi:MAG: PIG-L family deacetylase [Nitrospirae bacterium]|nr:PIG-L family deacetylase [Nitrospirota bacterium]
MGLTDSYQRIFSKKNRILAVFAHPDDAELYAGGTIARLTQDGKIVRVVKVTSGNRGSRQEKGNRSGVSKAST